MNLRVDLIHPEEKRYQGPVSLRFAISIGATTLGAVALLLLAVGLHGFLTTRSGLRTARDSWQRIETHHTLVTGHQKKDGENRALLAELDRWAKLRTPWAGLLTELQGITPATVQYTRLAVRSDWSFVKGPAPTTSDGKEIPQTAVPSHKLYVSLEGRATGDLADEVVVGFVRTLGQSPGFDPLLDTVKLQRLVREPVPGADKQADRLFLIEGEFFPRKLE